MSAADLLQRSFPGRRAELKRSVLGAALRCFNNNGIEATTIEMIRHECDTSVGAIYHHFGNKEGLVAALFFAAMSDQADLRQRYLESAQTARDIVNALVFSYVDWVEQVQEWFSRPGVGELLKPFPLELVPSLIIGSAESYCRAWLSGRVKQSPSVHRHMLADAAWRSLQGA